ncbi:S46 family peptidase [Vulgatibacter incomptus]|nr:S46 family peptidase [Vulgatibacter incomptus]
MPNSKHRLRKAALAGAAGVLVASAPAFADEGMWTYDNFPAAKVKEKYGFEPGQDWLDHVRLSSARLAGGCSASFVSANGLVLTNHHCVHSCVQQLSSAKHDYVQQGFLARTKAEERVCPAMELNQLVSITDVTAEIADATNGLEGKAYSEALNGAMSGLEKSCASGSDVRCDVVTLYSGGRYHLYKYRRFQDVRLVWAPELSTAFFGGDPDNFMFPRFNLDAAFVRAYENGKPAQLDHFLRWSEEGAKAGDLSFTSGHPGRTDRQLTIAELEVQRDVLLPRRLIYLSELRGMLTEFRNRGPEQKRTANGLLFYVENSTKALGGMRNALVEKDFFASKVADEQKLRAWVAEDPTRAATYGAAWDRMAGAQREFRASMNEYYFVEGGNRSPWGFQGDFFGFARTLVRAAEEKPKASNKRLREYNDANLPAIEARLFSGAPFYPELDEALLTFSLTKLREALGTDHPFVKNLLGKESPETVARKAVRGSKLGTVGARRALYEGGAKAIAASNDPMIVLARRIDADARAIRTRYEEKVDGPQRVNGGLIAKAKFEAYGTSVYPDATFTLRLSYGAVEGWEQDGKAVAPITELGGAFERATGEDPYALPPSWLKAKGKLALATPMNFVSTNDIVGGNSGSPVVNRNGEVIGLIFDGNLPSLGGDYGFDPAVNRAVAVHSQAIIESLRTIYGASSLVDELLPVNTANGR